MKKVEETNNPAQGFQKIDPNPRQSDLVYSCMLPNNLLTWTPRDWTWPCRMSLVWRNPCICSFVYETRRRTVVAIVFGKLRKKERDEIIEIQKNWRKVYNCSKYVRTSVKEACALILSSAMTFSCLIEAAAKSADVCWALTRRALTESNSVGIIVKKGIYYYGGWKRERKRESVWERERETN